MTEQNQDAQSLAQQRAARIVELAYQTCQVDGQTEINLDHDPVQSLSEGEDNGCYVRAWVWVSFEGTEFDKSQQAA